MKKFFVSKSDESRVSFIKKALDSIETDNVWVICSKERGHVYSSLNAKVLPMKELNKAGNWIEFVNTFTNSSMLVIDNVLQFMFFGDGKKDYLKNFAQRINHCIVTDVVPFYTEPYEIFYPFYFLGKEILGYNSYNAFKANHSEEKPDGSIDFSHSFDVLKHKISDYYVQDYEKFFLCRGVIEWCMSDSEYSTYLEDKANSQDYKNPVQLITKFADYINLLPSKASKLIPLIKGKTAIVLNYALYAKFIKSMLPKNIQSVDFITYHVKDCSAFSNYDTIIYYDNIIVKPHNVFYIEPFIRGNIHCFVEKRTNLDTNLFSKVYNIPLRNEFDKHFYEKNL